MADETKGTEQVGNSAPSAPERETGAPAGRRTGVPPERKARDTRELISLADQRVAARAQMQRSVARAAEALEIEVSGPHRDAIVGMFMQFYNAGDSTWIATPTAQHMELEEWTFVADERSGSPGGRPGGTPPPPSPWSRSR